MQKERRTYETTIMGEGTHVTETSTALRKRGVFPAVLQQANHRKSPESTRWQVVVLGMAISEQVPDPMQLVLTSLQADLSSLVQAPIFRLPCPIPLSSLLPPQASGSVWGGPVRQGPSPSAFQL